MTPRELARELGVAPGADLLAAVRELRTAAYEDALTGLPNRRALERDAQPGLAVLLIDLDRFKQVNDEHGHDAGDEVLRHAAKRLQVRLRRGDRLYRLGGDEFAVLLRAGDGPGAASRVERDLRTPGLPSVGVSCGHGRTLRAADSAMYRRKRARKLVTA